MSEIAYALTLLIGGVTSYIYMNKQNDNLIYVKSTIDGKDYLVQNDENKQESANLLAKCKNKMVKLCKILEKDCSSEKCKEYDIVKRLLRNFNSDKIMENIDKKYTSYSLNKGEKIMLCIKMRDKDNNLVDENVLFFVACHELAHCACAEIGHTDKFWKIFKYILKKAEQNKLYIKQDYANNPQPYCGMTITSSPI